MPRLRPTTLESALESSVSLRKLRLRFWLFLGLSILERLADDLKDVAVVENQPKMEGRNMHMLIAPLPGAAQKKKETNKKAEGKDE